MTDNQEWREICNDKIYELCFNGVFGIEENKKRENDRRENEKKR